jgi:catechol 2,3-dioxygenase-like lactoylglutathione lyase family enzyme
MPTEIRHLAIVSENYALLGKFYEAVFGLETADDSRPEAAVSLSDGYVGLNVNPRTPGRQAGLDHFGLLVDSVDEVAARLRDDWPNIQLLKRPSNRPFAGISMHDPCGNVFDLSQEGMENRASVYTESAKKGHGRRISHVQLRSVDTPTLARFYTEVFGLTPREKAANDPNEYLTDGTITLVLAPWRLSDYEGGGIERPALDHFGFVVEDIAEFAEDLSRVSGRNPHLAPRAFKAGLEGDSRLYLLGQCRYGERQLADPDGVLIDVHASA